MKLNKDKLLPVEEIPLEEVLVGILSHGFTGTSMTSTASKLVNLLKKYYNVDYITLYSYTKGGWYSTIATNIDISRITATEKYYNSHIRGISSKSFVNIIDGYNPDSFLSQHNLKYSNFTILTSYDGRKIGGILLENRKYDDNFKNRIDNIYEKLFNVTALVLSHLLEVTELVAMVSTDQLTGVYNRRYIDLTLLEEIEKHKSLGQTFNISLMDIDHFKKFNDTYGHQFGDKVLQEVSNYIKSELGKHSWIARYGGEEFLLFFAKSETVKVYDKVEAIREGISKLLVEYEGVTSKVTASFGIANYPKDGNSVESVIEEADKALYKSKELGRNRVTISSKSL